LEELFSDQSQADGSLAIDQTTVNVDDGNDDNEDVAWIHLIYEKIYGQFDVLNRVIVKIAAVS
jgi:hypothetical protein